MPHDQITVKSQRSIDHDFPHTRTNDSRQPSRLSRIHQQENGIMRFYERFEEFYLVTSLGCRGRGDGMAWHWDSECMSRRIL
jgi:hypothetical protein